MTRKKEAVQGPVVAFEMDVPSFRAALKDVGDVVEKRSAVPVLSNVLLTVTQTGLTLTATDLDTWGERYAPLDGEADPMAITVEAATLRKIADKLPSEARVRLALQDGKLTVSAGRTRFTLPTLPVEDFPMLPRRDWDAEFEVAALYLEAALSTVGFAVSTEETRYYLNGVLMHAPGGEVPDLRFAATDGHRLARGIMALPEGAEALPDVIIPNKVVKVLRTLLSRHEGNVDVRVSRDGIRVEIGTTVVQAKVIDGTFPDYTRVVPASHTGVLKVDRAQLLAAVARVTTVSSDKTRVVKVDLGRDLMTLSVASPENGTAFEELPCDWAGAPLTIGFNARYLSDILDHLSALEIEGCFTDAGGPTLWRDREGATATFVLMPTRT